MTLPGVRSILRKRICAASKREARTDPFHVALVVECGGMRGVAAGGVLHVLAEAGMHEAFDSLHGSSAGGCAAAYFASGQTIAGRKIYSEDISNIRVVNPRRLFSRPTMVDTDYIIDEVIAKRRRLDTGQAISKPNYLNIITTRVKDGAPTVHNHFATSDDVYTALRASLRVPGPCERGVCINGDRHLDGGLGAPIPVFSALSAGATHVLIVGTQRWIDYGPPTLFDRATAGALRLIYGHSLARSFYAAQAARPHVMQSMTPSVIVAAIARPSNSMICDWFTIDQHILDTVEQDAMMAARSFLASE